jgi:hypothetical protein
VAACYPRACFVSDLRIQGLASPSCGAVCPAVTDSIAASTTLPLVPSTPSSAPTSAILPHALARVQCETRPGEAVVCVISSFTVSDEGSGGTSREIRCGGAPGSCPLRVSGLYAGARGHRHHQRDVEEVCRGRVLGSNRSGLGESTLGHASCTRQRMRPAGGGTRMGPTATETACHG